MASLSMQTPEMRYPNTFNFVTIRKAGMDGENQFVENIMHTNVISIDSAMTVKDAAVMMSDADVGCVVVTDGGKPVGIITERDLVRRIIVKNKPQETTVVEVMSAPLITTRTDVPIWDLAQKMKVSSIHKIPVERNGTLIGIVTATDIVKAHSLASDTELCKITEQVLNRLQ